MLRRANKQQQRTPATTLEEFQLNKNIVEKEQENVDVEKPKTLEIQVADIRSSIMLVKYSVNCVEAIISSTQRSQSNKKRKRLSYDTMPTLCLK